jgi:hypothetical protein
MRRNSCGGRGRKIIPVPFGIPVIGILVFHVFAFDDEDWALQPTRRLGISFS